MDTDDPSGRRFVHTRLIAATPEQVFRAFSQPERLARWWGPDGFSSSFETFDFRTGGSWRFVMHGPDGSRYPNENVFKTVAPPDRLEVEHISDDHHFILRITLAARGDRTLVGWEQTFDTLEHKQHIAPWVEPANEQNLDRLEREVAGAEQPVRRGPSVRKDGAGAATTEATMQIEGACHCGSISFTAEVDPSRVMVCHCTDCQVLSGAPFRAVVAAPIDAFVLHGTPKSYVKVAQSGNRRAQVFCPDCATPLYATAPENPTSVIIRLGCVKQRSQLVPAAQIWQRSALPWLSELHRIEGSPEQQAFMPAPPKSG